MIECGIYTLLKQTQRAKFIIYSNVILLKKLMFLEKKKFFHFLRFKKKI